ncbi:HD-GYP domain-containing protein [Colwelliaceae bacterium 6471]
MSKIENNSTLQEISISTLTPGMYVVSISKGSDNTKVKSEGYILNKNTIEKLVAAKITRVTIDPSKTKKTEKIDKVLPDIPSTPLKYTPVEKPAISLEQEIKKANQLYQNAKGLQSKILTSITQGKVIDTAQVKRSTDAIVDSIFRNQDALSCMSRLRSKDEYLVEHSLNVSILMTIFAKHLGIDKDIIEQLALGAFLHDVGKILVPSEILNKRGKLSPTEYEIMKKHVALGVKVLEDTPTISHMIMSIVKEHHERIDGSGYPLQLKDEEISKYGRMIAIVDSYDAMTAERNFKASIHPIKAFKVLVNESPNSYDEELVERFIQCLGVYPVGTLVKLNSGKLGLISQLTPNKPLHPFVRVFYNTRLNQAIAIEEINLSKSKYKDQIDCCIKPEEFNINLLSFFKAAFID